MENIKKAYACKDGDGHWYVIPFEMKDLFFSELEKGEQDEWENFITLFSQYMTGGDLNNTQLYAIFTH